jgi:S-formylglutathione hydrolase FrmB
MRQIAWLAALMLPPLLAAPAPALGGPKHLEAINQHLAGHLDDYTNNHGSDNRIWSKALGECRDLYVYRPPGFHPDHAYPLLLWLHGLYEDEQNFIHYGGLKMFDEAMAAGTLPPFLIAIPDGTLRGKPTLFGTNPLWLDSQVGPYETYLMRDVIGFIVQHYPVRPEREAHLLGGFSGGGGSAFRLAIKYRPDFGICFGIAPPLNVRWLDCHGHYFAPFHPDCWGWRTNVNRGNEVLARFYGLITIRLRHVVYPLYGTGPEAVASMSRNNPIEMLVNDHVLPGQLKMYAAYGGRDQFNISAQVESFLYRAKQLGLTVAVGYDPKGHHNFSITGRRLLPGILEWLGPLLAPYCPTNP